MTIMAVLVSVFLIATGMTQWHSDILMQTGLKLTGQKENVASSPDDDSSTRRMNIRLISLITV